MQERDLTQLLAPAISALGLALVGIEMALTHGSGLVRVYIEHPERAVTLEDCEAASREISALMDLNDPISGHYTLEVSSPGVARPLFTPAHFASSVGEKAKVELSLPINGRRRLQARIVAVAGDEIEFDQDGVSYRVPHASVHRARIMPDYDALFGTGQKPGKPAKPGKAAKGGKSGSTTKPVRAAPGRKQP